MSQETTHPTDERLRAFAAGRLGKDECEFIEQHLSVCEECALRSAGEGAPNDAFLAALKDAHQDSQRSVASTHSRRLSSEDTRAWSPGTTDVLVPGTAFGRYTVHEVLGSGAFATVYRAVDRKLNRDVALKVLRGDATAHDVRRFLREARAVGQLSHKNICPVHDMGQRDGMRFIVMALVRGRTLREHLDSGKTVTPKQALQAVYKLASALKLAHEHGIVHRDLKPANIMIDSDRRELVILDFGLARRIGPEASRLTQKGDVLGTPAYMSPEQVRGDVDETGPHSDVYSLGVILYELLTGRPPFEGSVGDVIAKVVTEVPTRPSTVRPAGLNRDLDRICLKALAKDPKHRYQTMGEFRCALTKHARRKRVTLSAEQREEPLECALDGHREADRKPQDSEAGASLKLAALTRAWGVCQKCQAPRPPGTALCLSCGYHHGMRWQIEGLSQPSATHGFVYRLAAVLVGINILACVMVWIGASVGAWTTIWLVGMGAVIAMAVIASVADRTGSRKLETFALHCYRACHWAFWWRRDQSRVLNLRGSETRDDEVRQFKAEWGIEVLDLERTPITDSAISDLARLTSLHHLVLCRTRVSLQGIRQLKQRLPKTRIWY